MFFGNFSSAMEGPIRSFLVSLNFLTVFNFGRVSFADLGEVGRSSWCFPMVGLLIGSALYCSHWIFGSFLPPAIVSLITVGLWIFITGGLHLDGWTDCCDALGAAVSQERRAEIIKDSRLGSFGAMGLFLILGLKVACLSTEMVGLSGFVLATVTGRSLMIAVFRNCSSMKPGMAKSFTAGIDSLSYNLAWIFALLFAMLMGVAGMIALGLAYFCVLAFKQFAENKLGFVNGDVMGASCELSETLVLIALNWR